MVKKILFVCTGNTCRSAMAFYLATALAQTKYPEAGFVFDSAGLMAATDMPATAEAQQVLAKDGIDMQNHRSKILNESMVEESDLILTMTVGHKHYLLEGFPASNGKTFALGEVSGSNGDVHDPYCGSYKIYEGTVGVLKTEIAAALANIVNNDLPV